MAWIESHQTLDNHPKLIRACGSFKISRAEMVGHLHLLWHWCLDYAIDGDLSKYQPLQIARAAGWDADPETFVMILTECSFLDEKNGKYKIHDWFDFCGVLVKKRMEYANQKRDRSQTILRN